MNICNGLSLYLTSFAVLFLPVVTVPRLRVPSLSSTEPLHRISSKFFFFSFRTLFYFRIFFAHLHTDALRVTTVSQCEDFYEIRASTVQLELLANPLRSRIDSCDQIRSGLHNFSLFIINNFQIGIDAQVLYQYFG